MQIPCQTLVPVPDDISMKLRRIAKDSGWLFNDLVVMILERGLAIQEPDPEYYRLPKSEEFEEGC